MNHELISIDRNDSFSYLRGLDLQDLLVQIEKLQLEYRNLLNLPNDITFGVEIEYEKVLKAMVDQFVENNMSWSWISGADGSLNSGGEVRSPIMRDEEQYWQELKMICDYLTKKRADTLHNAGGHIHVGTNSLKLEVDAWRHFLKLYTIYEHVLFRFAYGDKISGRKLLMKYSSPIADEIYAVLDELNLSSTISHISSIFPIDGDRYRAINFKNARLWEGATTVDNTMEFRFPNATTSAVVWQNNINAFTKMTIASREQVMDEEFLDYKLKNEFYTYEENEYLYNNVSLKDALEFVDLVFDNNLDKAYFLRQYFKDFQENYGIKEPVNVKRFIK